MNTKAILVLVAIGVLGTDEIWLFLAPIVIGGGRAVFDGAGAATLAEAQRFAFDPPKTLGADLLFRGVRRERH
jgi:riboflavin biosynthesis pyrimidine reductase